jgi:hypothetical protein
LSPFSLVQRCSGDSAAGDTVKALFKFLSVAFVVLRLLALLFGGGTTSLVLIGIGMSGISIAAYNR